jgi:hypothetical protein
MTTYAIAARTLADLETYRGWGWARRARTISERIDVVAAGYELEHGHHLVADGVPRHVPAVRVSPTKSMKRTMIWIIAWPAADDPRIDIPITQETTR